MHIFSNRFGALLLFFGAHAGNECDPPRFFRGECGRGPGPLPNLTTWSLPDIAARRPDRCRALLWSAIFCQAEDGVARGILELESQLCDSIVQRGLGSSCIEWAAQDKFFQLCERFSPK